MINTVIKKIYIASDHAAFKIKYDLVEFLIGQKLEIEDLGTHSEQSCHYPVYAKALCEKLKDANEFTQGILLCGSGIGVSMVANRYPWIRAARCTSIEDAKMSKAHNNANVLCLGSRVNNLKEMKEMIQAWLNTSFEGGRHQERIDLFSRNI